MVPYARRLVLLKQYLDPMTHRRVSSLGLRKAWHCLEIGGGAGRSRAGYQVRLVADRRVVGTAIVQRFLEEIRERSASGVNATEGRPPAIVGEAK